MIDKRLIERINELSRKMKSIGLTTEEKAEQTQLRKQYLASFRASLRQQLDQIEIVDEPKNSH